MMRPLLRAVAVCLPLLILSTLSWAQCPGGELEVTIDVITDDWGNETYWQLVPAGNACGQAPIYTGGNMVLNCTSGGTQASPAGGYANNTTYPTGPWCLVEGAQYSIIVIDSYGDGQASFNVYVEGASAGQFGGSGGMNTWTFTVAVPPDHDMGVVDLTTPLYNTVGITTSFTGTVRNFGAVAVNAFTLNIGLNGVPSYTQKYTGLGIASGGDYEFELDGPWTPGTAEDVALTVWATNINGSPDENAANDVGTAQLVVNDAIPDLIDDYLSLPPTITVIADDDEDLLVPRDLDFHPDRQRNELWVINKDVEGTGGSTVKFTDAGEPAQTHLWQRDPNAWHFMSLPTAIAFGDNDNFSTAPGVFDANHNGGQPFTGISLWSSDPAIYAQGLFGPLGSHLDMLHVTPNAQGITHERWNRYWVVDGYNHDVVMHDFRADHGPGQDYHGNAIIRRYAGITIQRDPAEHIVSHCVLDKNSGWLYVVDHGNARVVRLDTHTGTVTGPGSFGPFETYVEYSQMGGHVWETVASTGLSQPAGIELVGNHLLVSDHANGDIVVYDISAPGFPELGRIATGVPGIMGMAVAPDGRIWYVNATSHSLVRIDLNQNVGVAEHVIDQVQAYPNPASDRVFLRHAASLDATLHVRLLDATGRVVVGTTIGMARGGIDVADLASGAYSLVIGNGSVQRVVITR